MGIDYITPQVAISSLTEADNETELLKRNFTRVVNVCEHPSKYSTIIASEIQMPSAGRPEPEVLDIAADEVDRLVNEGHRVLVHCLEGIDRSPTVVMRYLMKKQGIGAEAARRKIQAHRPQADPHVHWLEPMTPEERERQLWTWGGSVYQEPYYVDDLHDIDTLMSLPVDELSASERGAVIRYLEEIPAEEMMGNDLELLEVLKDAAKAAEESAVRGLPALFGEGEPSRGMRPGEPWFKPEEPVPEGMVRYEGKVMTKEEFFRDYVRPAQAERDATKTRADLFREEKEAEKLEDLEFRLRQKLKRGRWKDEEYESYGSR